MCGKNVVNDISAYHSMLPEPRQIRIRILPIRERQGRIYALQVILDIQQERSMPSKKR